MALIDEVKEYCRTDDDLSDYITSAQEYLKNAGIEKNEENALYRLAVKILVSHWYDNRNAVTLGVVSKSLEYSLQSIMSQLKYCYVENGE